eukprot:scaffold348426_cov52-Prasinocladus_malaysianus.AAC.1
MAMLFATAMIDTNVSDYFVIIMRRLYVSVLSPLLRVASSRALDYGSKLLILSLPHQGINMLEFLEHSVRDLNGATDEGAKHAAGALHGPGVPGAAQEERRRGQRQKGQSEQW